MKLSGLVSRTSSSSSVKSTGSKFSLKAMFGRRRSSGSSSSTQTSSPVESLFEEPTMVLESEVVAPRDVHDFDTDDLSSIDSMFDSYSSMSEPHLKTYNGYRTVVHQGRNMTKDWEMRYDTILCQFYYVNRKDQRIQFDSPSEVLQF